MLNFSKNVGLYVLKLRCLVMKTRLIKEINWGLQVNNIFNKLYEPNGYTYSYYFGGKLETQNFYYPMAGTNFMIAMNIKL